MLDAKSLAEIDDGQAVKTAASALRTAMQGFKDRAGTVQSDWQPISTVFHAPDENLVWTVMDSPASDAVAAYDDADHVARAVEMYGDDLIALETRRKNLLATLGAINSELPKAHAAVDGQGLGSDFCDRAGAALAVVGAKKVGHWVSGDETKRLEDLQNQEDQLLEDISQWHSDLDDAQRRCSNSIGARFGWSDWKSPDKAYPWEKDCIYGATSDMYYKSVKSSSAATKDWGFPDGWENIGLGRRATLLREGGLDNAIEFGESLASLLNPFDLPAFTNGWAGMGEFAYHLSPRGMAYDTYRIATAGSWGAAWDYAKTLPGPALVSSTLCTSTFRRDPYRSIGGAIFNIGTIMLLPGAGGGKAGTTAMSAGTRLGRGAAVASKGAGTVGSFSRATKMGAAVDAIPRTVEAAGATSGNATKAAYIGKEIRFTAPSADFSAALSARKAAHEISTPVRERLEAIAEKHGVRIEDLQGTKLDKTLEKLQGQGKISSVEAVAIKEISAAEKGAAKSLKKASENLGLEATTDVLKSSGESSIKTPSSKTGSGTFDDVGRSNSSFTCYEAKGGKSSELGTRKVNGVDYEQGTQAYWQEMLSMDPDVQALFRAEPEYLAKLQRGEIKMEYVKIRATPTGQVKVRKFAVDPAKLDWSKIAPK